MKKGVIVRFEILDDDDNIINVIAEQTFPDAVFNSWSDPLNKRFIKYRCFDENLSEYLFQQHNIYDFKYNYVETLRLTFLIEMIKIHVSRKKNLYQIFVPCLRNRYNILVNYYFSNQVSNLVYNSL